MRYTAWGEVRYNSGVTPTDYTYTGQYSYAEDFGLMFYNARWYDPALGRFAQADSIVPPGVQGLDRYAYVENNPIKYTDPSGHCRMDAEADDCLKGDKSNAPKSKPWIPPVDPMILNVGTVLTVDILQELT
jgi:RHS repeat-associated protein